MKKSIYSILYISYPACMSNRILWILIIFWCIMAWVAFYMYAFLHYTWSIQFRSNRENYSIKLFHLQTMQTFEKNCEKKECVLPNIPPFTYSLSIRKKWYKSIDSTLIIDAKESKSVPISLQKDTQLEIQNTIQIKKNTTPSVHENTIKNYNEKKYYAYFKLLNLGEIFLKEENNGINVYLRNEIWTEKKILSVSDRVKKKNISILRVDGNDSIILFKYGKKNYLYNHQKASMNQIQLTIPILYIKQISPNYLHFITKKWTFTYKNEKLQYSDLFVDFVVHDKKYIWIITSSDTRRKKDFLLESHNWTLIVLYDPLQKWGKSIYQPEFWIEKIILEHWEVVIIGTNKNKYTLKNY